MSRHSKKIYARHERGGFTLLEIVLSLAIGAALAVIAAMALGLVRDTEVRVKDSTETRTQALIILELLSKELRSAQTITSPVSGGSGQLLSYEKHGAVVPSSFSLHDDALWWVDVGGAEFRLTNDRVRATTFTVTRTNATGNSDSLTATLGLTANDSQSVGNLTPQERTFTTSVTMRAPTP